jgi:hypothetical protein
MVSEGKSRRCHRNAKCTQQGPDSWDLALSTTHTELIIIFFPNSNHDLKPSWDWCWRSDIYKALPREPTFSSADSSPLISHHQDLQSSFQDWDNSHHIFSLLVNRTQPKSWVSSRRLRTGQRRHASTTGESTCVRQSLHLPQS